MRKIVAVIPVCLAFLLSSCAGSIDKALYSIAEGLTEKDKITGLRSLSLQDRKEQIKKADSHARDIIKKQGGNINEGVSRSQYRRLQRIFERIHKVSHFRDEKWTVVLLPDKEFNAFVTGGTYVFANLGFMEFCNDDEVAAVIGHEIGHVVANHSFEAHSYMVAAALAGAKNLEKEGYAEGFNRNQEAEADKIGVMYMALAGYNPDMASGFWNRLTKKYGDRVSMTRSHPMNEQRAKNNAHYAKQVRQYYTQGKTNPNFEKLLVKNILWDASGSDLEVGKGGGLAAAFSAVADTTIKHYGAKAEREQMRQRQNQQQFTEAVGRLVRVVESAQVSQDGATMRIGFQYVGDVELNNISFSSDVVVGQHRLQMTSDSGGPIKPGMSFYVLFQGHDLPSYAPYIQSGQADIRYSVINAR